MKKLKKNRNKFLILTLVGSMFLISGCTSNSDVSHEKDNSKYDDTNVEVNDTITSDHITNNRVQEIFDAVNFEGTSMTELNHYEDNFINSLNNKIGLILTHDKVNALKFSSGQLNYINKTYSTGDYINTENGYYSVDEVMKQLNNIFNISVTSEEVSNLNKNNLNYGTFNSYLYDNSITGFLRISIPAGCSSPGECIYKLEKVYNYVENGDSAIVDTIIAYKTDNKYFYQSNNVDKIYKDKNVESLVYENIDLDTFEFSEEDQNKFIKLRYTFNKRDDNTYYFANVEKID